MVFLLGHSSYIVTLPFYHEIFFKRFFIYTIVRKFFLLWNIKLFKALNFRLYFSYKNYRQYLHVQIIIKLLLLLIGHRILRKLNSTGDKYAHLPDIAGFLLKQENILSMTIVLVTGLILLIWIDFSHESKTHKIQFYTLALNSIISICIYLRHMHNGNVAKIVFYPKTSGVYEVQIFWFLLLINFLTYIYNIIQTKKHNAKFFLKISLYFILKTWIMISAMLHKPHNVILLPFQIIFSNVISEIIKNGISQDVGVILYIWIGNVFYFYQGNSNSLATIDVAAGYVGVQSYIPFINGSLLLINTYSSPVLAYFLLIYYSILEHSYNIYEIVTQINKMYIMWRLIPMTLYTIIISIQRHHLFIWSVFSPKLLYEATYFTIMCVVVFIVLILTTLQKIINKL